MSGWVGERKKKIKLGLRIFIRRVKAVSFIYICINIYTYIRKNKGSNGRGRAGKLIQ